MHLVCAVLLARIINELAVAGVDVEVVISGDVTGVIWYTIDHRRRIGDKGVGWPRSRLTRARDDQCGQKTDDDHPEEVSSWLRGCLVGGLGGGISSGRVSCTVDMAAAFV